MNLDLTKLVELLKQALPVAKMLAAITTTKWDDEVVKIMEAVLSNNDLLAFLLFLFNSPKIASSAGPARDLAFSNALAAIPDTTLTAAKSAADKAGLPWPKIIQYVPQIITLVLTILGLRR